MATTIAYTVKIETSDSTKRVAALELELEKLNQEVRNAKKLGDQDLYEKLRTQQIGLRTEVNEARKAVRQQAKDIRDAKFPTDSLIGLRTEYRKLRREIDALDADARNSKAGESLIKQAREYKTQIDRITASTGDFRSQVGNYQESIENALQATGGLLSGDLTALFSGFAGGAAITAGIDLFIQAASAVADLVIEFSNLKNEVEQVTGLTGEALDDASIRVSALADTFGKSSDDILLAANAAAKGFGVDFSEALDAVQVGLIKGLDINGEFLDNLREYPAVIDNAGFSLQQFILLSNQQLQDGVFSDKLIDTIKEFDLAVKELGSSQLEALSPLGADFVNSFAQAIREGSINTREALFLLSDRAKQVGLDVSQLQTITADLFKGAGEDAGSFEKILSSVFSALDQDFEGFSENLNSVQQRQLNALAATNEFKEAQKELTDELDPLIGNINTLGTRIQTLLLNALVDVTKEVNEFIEPIREANSAAIELAETFGLNGNALSSFISRIIRSIGGIKVVKDAFDTIQVALNFVSDAITRFYEIVEPFAARTKAAFDTAGQFAARLGLVRNRQNEVVESSRATGEGFSFFSKQVDKANKGLSDSEQDLKNYVEVNKELKKEVEKTGVTIEDLELKIKALKDELKKTEIGSEAYNTKLAELNSSKLRLKQLTDQAKSSFDALSGAIKTISTVVIADYRRQIAELRADLERPVGERLFDDLNERIQSATIQLIANNPIKVFQQQIKNLQKELDEATDAAAFAEIQQRLNDANLLLEQALENRRRLLDQRNGLFDAIEPIERADVADLGSEEGIVDLLGSEEGLGLEESSRVVRAKSEQEAINEILEENIKRQNALRDKQFEDDAERDKKRLEQAVENVTAVGDVIADFASGQLKTIEDFQKELLLIGLKAVEAQIPQLVVQITGKEFASKGFLGFASAAILTGALKGLLAVARNAIQGFADGGEVQSDGSSSITGSSLPVLEGGGIVNVKQNIPTQANSDNVLATVKVGEVFINKDQERRGKQLFGNNFLSQMGVPGFAEGGRVSTPSVPNFVSADRVQEVTGNAAFIDPNAINEQANKIAEQTAREVGIAVREGIEQAEIQRDRRESANRRRKF